ncbi:MAG TPA: carboxypeptidase-like regulatory domain-containing protein [Kofleriaceae bacterium]|jgi:protocatechuate 3,4-dioxygenase beta subunit
MSNRAWLLFAASLLALWWLLAGGEDAAKAPSMKPTSTDTASVPDGTRPATVAELLRNAHEQLDTSLQFTRARLEGVVLDEKNEPLGKAVVHLGAETTTAGDDGSFAFDNIATGDVLISAELGDLYGERSTVFSEGDELIEIHVRRGPSLTVHVVSAKTHQPIAGAALDVGRIDRTTDATGVAVFRGLDPTGERISVAAEGYASIRIDVPMEEEHPFAPIAMTIPLEGGAPIKGIVLDPSGALVPDAQVKVETESGHRIDIEYTDDHGAFVIPAVAAGPFTIVASSHTFIEAPKQHLQHDGIHELTGIKVHVVRGAEVAGRVVDEAGKPVAGVVIDGLLCDDTDADGRFLAQGLDPGERTVSAHDALHGSVSQKITVEIGKRQELTFVLTVTGIAGKVVDKHGNGLPDATVYAHLTTDEYETAMATTDEYGAFDLGGITPGTWVLVAQRAEEASRPMPKGNGVTVKAGTRGVKLELPELSTLAARITLDGQPVAYYGVRIVQHVEGSDDSDWGGRTDNVNDDNGAFERSDLAPGVYDIMIVGPNFKKKELPRVTMREGARTDLGTIAMDRGRTVHGHVVDDRHVPIAGALVAIGQVPNHLSDSPIAQRMSGDATTHTDASGAFSISGLEPMDEELKIVATHATAGITIMRMLTPGEDNIELVMVETGDIVGSIDNYNEDAGSNVTVTDVNGNMFDGDVDAAGHFEVHAVPPGDAEVRVYGKNSLSPEKTTVLAGQTVTVHFAMPKNPIEVELAITLTHECNWVSFDGEGAHGSESCDQNVAHFHAVPPGTYTACEYPECGTFTVAPSPATQKIAVTFTPMVDDTTTPDEPTSTPATGDDDPDTAVIIDY